MMKNILDAASRVLERKGLFALNTTAIAEEAGASIGSIYQYFPNRDAITAALILRQHQLLLSGLRSAVDRTEGLPLRAAIKEMIGTAIPRTTSEWKLTRALELEEERLPKTVQLQTAETEIQALNISFLRRYFAEDRLSDEAMETVSFDVTSIIRGMIDSSLSRSESANSDLAERITCAAVGYLLALSRPSTLKASLRPLAK